MERGYIKLWRKTLDSGLLTNPPLMAFFVWCLVRATHKPHKQMVGNHLVELEAGQFIFGRKQAAKELKSSEQRIRTLIKSLIKLEIIEQKSTNQYSIITLVNWDTYQGVQPASQPATNQHLTSDQPAPNHKQECKELKNVKKESKPIGRFTPPTLEEVGDYGRDKKKGSPKTVQDFIDYYTSNGWRVGKNPMKSWTAAYSRWCRNEINQPSKQKDTSLDRVKRLYLEAKEQEDEADRRDSLGNETNSTLPLLESQ